MSRQSTNVLKQNQNKTQTGEMGTQAGHLSWSSELTMFGDDGHTSRRRIDIRDGHLSRPLIMICYGHVSRRRVATGAGHLSRPCLEMMVTPAGDVLISDMVT